MIKSDHFSSLTGVSHTFTGNKSYGHVRWDCSVACVRNVIEHKQLVITFYKSVCHMSMMIQ